MSIVSTDIVSDGGTPRRVVYACTDSTSAVHRYGPLFTTPDFDAVAHKTAVAAKVVAGLAENEANSLIGGA